MTHDEKVQIPRLAALARDDSRCHPERSRGICTPSPTSTFAVERVAVPRLSLSRIPWPRAPGYEDSTHPLDPTPRRARVAAAGLPNSYRCSREHTHRHCTHPRAPRSRGVTAAHSLTLDHRRPSHVRF